MTKFAYLRSRHIIHSKALIGADSTLCRGDARNLGKMLCKTVSAVFESGWRARRVSKPHDHRAKTRIRPCWAPWRTPAGPRQVMRAASLPGRLRSCNPWRPGVSFRFAVPRDGSGQGIRDQDSFMPTYVATPTSVTSRWHLIDAEGQVLGRVASHAARLLQGKHKATYTPVHRHRRPRRHHQRRQGQADRPQGRAEDVPPPQRLCRRAPRGAGRGGPPAQADAAGRRSRARHAAEDEAGRRDVPQVQGVCG